MSQQNNEGIEFEWDADNTHHIWNQHRIRPEQAEQAAADPNCIDAEAYSVEDEYRDGVIGMTDGGLVLQIIFTERHGRIRVVEAKRADARQRRAYRDQR